jgi:hypothetical protein
MFFLSSVFVSFNYFWRVGKMGGRWAFFRMVGQKGRERLEGNCMLVKEKRLVFSRSTSPIPDKKAEQYERLCFL